MARAQENQDLANTYDAKLAAARDEFIRNNPDFDPDSPEAQEAWRAWANEDSPYQTQIDIAQGIEDTADLPISPIGFVLDKMGVPKITDKLAESDNPRLQALSKLLKTSNEGVRDMRTGALQSAAGFVGRGIPEVFNQIFNPSGDVNTRLPATDRFIDDKVVKDREERSPVMSIIGSLIPELLAESRLPGGQAAPNPYRASTTLEKVADMVPNIAASGATAALMELIRPNSTGDRGERAQEAGLWGLGGGALGTLGSGAANWAKNARNKKSQDLALDEALNILNPQGNALRNDPEKYTSNIGRMTEDEYGRRQELWGGALDDIGERGKNYNVPPTNDPFIMDEGAALRNDPGFRGESIMDVNSRGLALGDPQDFGQRFEAIREVRAAARAAEKSGDFKGAERLNNTVARLQKELDDYANSSMTPGLPELSLDAAAARSGYRDNVGPFTDTSGTATGAAKAGNYEEGLLHSLFGADDLGQASRRHAELVPDSSPSLSALWMNNTFGRGKVPDARNTATQFHLGQNLDGGVLDDKTIGFLENLKKGETPIGAITKAFGRRAGLTASDLSNVKNSSILKYGSTPAEQLKKNYILAALRGSLGGEAFRYKEDN